MFKFFQTKAGQNFMAKLYGIGASVVILGAMFRSPRWRGISTATRTARR